MKQSFRDSPKTSPAGLSSQEAARRLKEEGLNLLPGSAPKSTARIVFSVLTEPMFLMLLTAGAIYLALGDRAEALFLLLFVFLVIGITLAQERRTQRALESLRDLSAPRALVRRDGREQRIAGREVVRGDILILHEGDRIPADAVLLEGRLSVNESLLTGESVPVSKQAATADDEALTAPGGDGTASLYASTVVTQGVGVAAVRLTAGATAVGQIGEALANTREPLSSLQLASRRLVRYLGVGALILASGQVLLGWWWDGRDLLQSLLAGIALAMAILPEEIPVILTVFLALGAWRIAQQKVLTRRVSAVEALGAITVLAVDKTGTLTQNRMAVVELATVESRFAARRGGAAPEQLPEEMHELVEFAMLATPADPFDPMEKAIQAFGHHWLAGTDHIRDSAASEFEYPLSSEILAMTRVFSGAGASQHVLATKGAPEAIADLCHLPDRQREFLRRQVEEMAARGLRVLGVARGAWESENAAHLAGEPAWPSSQHDFEFAFLGLIGLADPPRPEVPAAIAQCQQAGIRVVMMTGDHPATARAIAEQVGLSRQAEVITGAEMEAMEDSALLVRLRKVDLCARLQPAHKLRLVQVLQAGGEVVAMTGDGVNDAPALKAADIGIAMGERGTDVAREAAALVLLDDSFARIVDAIRQGRRIYDNIRKATRFTCAVHMPIIALALIPVLLHWPALLLPVHIVLLELLIDPACSIVFEAEPEAKDVMSRPPRQRGASPFALPNLVLGGLQGAGLAAILLVGQGMWLANDMAVEQGRSAVFVTLILDVLLLTLANRNRRQHAYVNAFQRNPWLKRMALAVIGAVLLILSVPMIRQTMGLAIPGQHAWLMIALMLGASLAWLLLLRQIWYARYSIAPVF